MDALSQALRLFTILHLLASRRTEKRIGRTTLARACNCSLKTIQRDLQNLQSAYIPIEYDPSERTYTLPDKGWEIPRVTLTLNDAMALALLRGLVEAEAALPFAGEIQAALDKATAGLAPALRTQMDAAAIAWTEFGGLARDYSNAPLRLLLLAVARRQTVEMVYASRNTGKTERRLVDPYRLDRRDGRYLEMQAWCHKHREVRTFALDRIQEAGLTDAIFEVRSWQPKDEGVVGGLRGGVPTRLEVRFDPEVAGLARARRWPFAAQFEEMENGGVVMRGEVQGVEGIVRELLSWRRHAEVLGGPELRAHMAEEAQAIAALYPDAKKF